MKLWLSFAILFTGTSVTAETVGFAFKVPPDIHSGYSAVLVNKAGEGMLKVDMNLRADIAEGPFILATVEISDEDLAKTDKICWGGSSEGKEMQQGCDVPKWVSGPLYEGISGEAASVNKWHIIVPPEQK